MAKIYRPNGQNIQILNVSESNRARTMFVIMLQSKCCLGPEERGVHHGEPSRPLPVRVPGGAPAPRRLQPRAELPAQHLQVAHLDTWVRGYLV